MAAPSRIHVDEDHWIPLADLMTGLMFLFLLIALAYMVRVEQQTREVKQIAASYQDVRSKLYQELDREFHNDLPKWGAQIRENDLSIRFTEPDVLFETGSAILRPRFKTILSDFFPRYVHILRSEEFSGAISEVRIEGHTSSQWTVGMGPKPAYINNMSLSQDRTRSVLQFLLDLPPLQESQSWLMSKVTANGLSSSRLIKIGGREDPLRSQRVEFKVLTDADNQIRNITQAIR